ncbi:MAG: hypothetical protein E7153_09185 [Enterococcus faecium]|uniref:Uncharacterized protein n=1 Tax=Enterococcus mundtii TaxID=53346 RepID=A0A2T5DE25_ENTMU|nr:hypothetical protein [Enterococcus faecium]PTO36171.1 hypothetical protein C6N14_05040 [Enterococcus mundtii]
MLTTKNYLASILSIALLAMSILLFLFYAYPYSKLQYEIRIFIMTVCWLCSTVSLFFSTKIIYPYLKRGIILLNFCCIYGWLFYFG